MDFTEQPELSLTGEQLRTAFRYLEQVSASENVDWTGARFSKVTGLSTLGGTNGKGHVEMIIEARGTMGADRKSVHAIVDSAGNTTLERSLPEDKEST